MTRAHGSGRGDAPAQPRLVLVVDDDQPVRRTICRCLEISGFRTIAAPAGLAALKRIRRLKPDLVLVDIGMPGLDGVKVVQIMRQSPATVSIPAILMTGLPIPAGALQVISESLGAGPIYVKDDFFKLPDRINASLARSEPVPAHRADHIIRRGPLALDLIRREVFVEGRHLPHLTAKLFDVLLALVRNGGTMSQEELWAEVWKSTADLKAVQMAVSRLKSVLKLFPIIQIRTFGRAYELIVLSDPSPSAWIRFLDDGNAPVVDRSESRD